MNKIIVTICSAALVVVGTLSVNQLSFNHNDAINTGSDNTAVVQYADKADENCLIEDSYKEAVTAPVKDTTDKAKAASPVETKAEDNIVVKASKKEAVNEVNSIAIAEQKDSLKKDAQAAVQKAPQTAEADSVKNTPVSSNTANKTAASDVKNAYVYKNVDLSQCNNIQEVVALLQKNGFKYITMGNVEQISSLKDILALICNKNNDDTSTPTEKPEKPTPTTKPERPTPTPTTKPERPTPTPTQAPSNDTNTGVSSYASQVLQLVNQERAKEGLSALTTNSTLQAAAEKRAQETVQSFSHTRPNGTSFSTVLKEYGISYRAAGENIAYGQKTPQEVVKAWMNSSGHRANIMSPKFGKIGIGVYQKNGVIYWSQLFTN